MLTTEAMVGIQGLAIFFAVCLVVTIAPLCIKLYRDYRIDKALAEYGFPKFEGKGDKKQK